MGPFVTKAATTLVRITWRQIDVLEKLVTNYNTERLHAALGYIEPWEAHFGDLEARRSMRAERLRLGRELRREKNRHQFMTAPTPQSVLN